MKYSKHILDTVAATQRMGSATLRQLMDDFKTTRPIQTWRQRCWRAEEMGLLAGSRVNGVVVYTVTDKGRDALAVDATDPRVPAVPMVVHALRSQPTSVWALGAAS